MLKSIIITTAILIFGAVNIHAAGLESDKRIEKRERSERNYVMDERMSFDNMMTGFPLSEDVSAGLVFGLDKEPQNPTAGPEDHSNGFGIGLGLSFSF